MLIYRIGLLMLLASDILTLRLVSLGLLMIYGGSMII